MKLTAAYVRRARVLVFATSACTRPLAAPLDVAPDLDAQAAVEGDRKKRPSTLRLASFSEPRTLDPAIASDGLAAEILSNVMAGIVDFDADGRPTPDLASRIERSADGSEWRVRLRAGVVFHDGHELGAHDVKRSLERALAPDAASPSASLFASLRGFDAYRTGRSPSVEGIVVEDTITVRFKLERADGAFLYALAMPPARPVCPTTGPVPAALPCGAGPFRATKLQRGDGVTLVRHGQYFRTGLPRLDDIEWTFRMTPLVQRVRFERGELDLLRELNQADLVRFMQDARWTSLVAPGPEQISFGECMNTEQRPFDDVHVRRAVAFAIDRSKYAALKPAQVRPSTQLLPQGMTGRIDDQSGQRFDRARALEEMALAGYPFDPQTGMGGYPNRIEYVTYARSLSEVTAQLLAQDLSAIGLRITLRLVSQPAYLALSQRPPGALFSTQGWTADYPHPSAFFEPLFHSRNATGAEVTNTAFFRDAELDGTLDRARATQDVDAQGMLYATASQRLVDQAPWAFTHTIRTVEVRQGYVQGFVPHPVWGRYLRDVSLRGADRREGPLRDSAAPSPSAGRP